MSKKKSPTLTRGGVPVHRLEDLTPDNRNANRGTARGRSLLERSIEQYGAGRSILVDKNGKVIGGNKTLEVAVEKGLQPRVVKTDGNELVVVMREDLDLDSSDGRARALAYLDNRVAEVDLAWDSEQLLRDVNDGIDHEGLGFRDDELAILLKAGDVEQTVAETERQVSFTARPPGPTVRCFRVRGEGDRLIALIPSEQRAVIEAVLKVAKLTEVLQIDDVDVETDGIRAMEPTS